MVNKLILFILLSVCSTGLFAQSGDIYIYTKTNASWNIFLLNELQQTMINFGKNYHMHSYQYTDSELTYDNSTIEDLLTDDTNEFLGKLEDMSGLGLLKIKPEISIKSIGYNLYNLSPEVTVKAKTEGVELLADISLNGLDIYADSLDINFVLPKLVSKKKVIALQVKLIKPRLSFSDGVTLPFKLGIILQKIKSGVKVSFSELELKSLAQTLRNSQHAFDFQFESLDIPDVSLEIMGRTIRVDEKKITATIMEYKENLKKLIIDQLAAVVAKDGFLALIKMFDGQVFPDEYWFNTQNEKKYPLVLRIKDLKKINENTLNLNLDGDFCSKQEYVQLGKGCEKSSDIANYPKSISRGDDIESRRLIEESLKKDDRQFVASISENYITKLIHGTIKNKEWDELLQEYEIKLGSKKAFVRFDEKGEYAKVYIDAVYRVGKIKGLLLGQRNVNFPIVLKVRPSIKYIEVDHQEDNSGEVMLNDLPHVVFTVVDIILEDNVLRYGVPEYELDSSIQRINFGFRRIVLRTIKKDLFQFDEQTNSYGKSEWSGTELPPLLFPELSNLYLEKLKFQSDGLGRGNFSFDGSDVLIRDID
jgi:hypothetical protein